MNQSAVEAPKVSKVKLRFALRRPQAMPALLCGDSLSARFLQNVFALLGFRILVTQLAGVVTAVTFLESGRW